MKRKRCVFDGGPINQKTQTQWVCGTCGLPYGRVLMTDRDAWKEFRRRAKIRLDLERETKPDYLIRPMVGTILSEIMLDLSR